MQKYKFDREAGYTENEDPITPNLESIIVSTPLIKSHLFIIDKVLQHIMNKQSKHMLKIQRDQYSSKKYLVSSKSTKLSLKRPKKM